MEMASAQSIVALCLAKEAGTWGCTADQTGLLARRKVCLPGRMQEGFLEEAISSGQLFA